MKISNKVPAKALQSWHRNEPNLRTVPQSLWVRIPLFVWEWRKTKLWDRSGWCVVCALSPSESDLGTGVSWEWRRKLRA